MKGKWFLAAVVSAVLGILHAVGLGYVWNHLVQVNPVPHWLITHGVVGNLLRALLFMQDAIINALLCLPLVFVLRLLRPSHPLAYLGVAVLVVEAWMARSILADPLPQGLGYDIFLPGFLVTMAAFAMAGAAMAGMARIRQASA